MQQPDERLPHLRDDSVAAVAAGDSHSLFAESDGTLWAMGRNDKASSASARKQHQPPVRVPGLRWPVWRDV
jgi:alpha-tubulin suppressor-like RCC1 family protein